MYTCIVSPVTIKILYVWLKYFYRSLAYFFLLNCIPSTVGFFLTAKRVFIVLLILIGKWCDFLRIRYNLIFFGRLTNTRK